MYVDGYGYPPYAKNNETTVTPASGSRRPAKAVAVSRNLQNRFSAEVSSWPYRDHVTGIAVSCHGMPRKAGITSRGNRICRLMTPDIPPSRRVRLRKFLTTEPGTLDYGTQNAANTARLHHDSGRICHQRP